MVGQHQQTSHLVCLSAILAVITVVAPIWATPPTVAPKEHPFDPDWVEVKLIIDRKCAACHRANTKRCDLTTYKAIVNGYADEDSDMKVVVPGKPSESVLWDYVAWNSTADEHSDLPDEPMMPSDETVEWLTTGELAIIKRWITNGALEYKLPGTCNIRPLMEFDFPSAQQCSQCHPKQYKEWSRSMHAYAQHSPFFEAFNLTLVERTGGTIGTFCSRCHTPIGTALGENASLRNAHRTRISREGVTCIVCHRRSKQHYKNNGRLEIEPGDLMNGCMYGPFESNVPEGQNGHAAKHLPYLRTAQFCGECHDVTNPAGVRLEEAYSEWANSPAAKDGITCQQCHMGPIQGVAIPFDQRPMGRAAVVPGVPPEKIPLRPLSNHSFAGPDYSVLPDTEFPHKRDWMYEVDYRNLDALTPYQLVSLAKLRKENQEQLRIARTLRYQVLRNGARLHVRAPQRAKAGATANVCVHIESILSGHSYPTGFTAERQLWVHIKVRDPLGNVVFESGDLDHNKDLRDDHSHEVLTGKAKYDKYLLNFQNKFITLTNKGTERSVILSVNRHLRPLNVLRPATGISASFGRPEGFRIAKGSLTPLGSGQQIYPVKLDQAGYYKVSVCLNFRHLPPSLLDHIGTPHLKHLLEVVPIASQEHTIYVAP